MRRRPLEYGDEEQEADLELLRRCNGLLVGQLNEEELAAFNRLEGAGRAERYYSHIMFGMLGLSTVRIW